jgi:hypothetical protein
MEKGEEKERKEERKQIATGKESFLGAGPTFMAVQQITAVRCN